MKKLLTFLVVLLVLCTGIVLVTEKVTAKGQDTCPQNNGWIKVDDLSGYSYTFDAPEGTLIVESCYKASTTVVFETYNPPQESVTVTSTVVNPGGQIAELSHASFRLVKKSTKTPPVVKTPTVTPPVEETPTVTPPVEETPTVTPPVEETPTVTPPVEETPTVTPPVEETPTVTPPVEETPTVTPPVEETPTVTPTMGEIITKVQTGGGDGKGVALIFIVIAFLITMVIWAYFRSRLKR